MFTKKPDVWQCSKEQWAEYMKTQEYQDELKHAKFMEDQRKEMEAYWVNYRKNDIELAMWPFRI